MPHNASFMFNLTTNLHKRDNKVKKSGLLTILPWLVLSVVEKSHGHLWIIGKDGIILAASHGTRKMTDIEIEKVYGRGRKKHIASEYATHLCVSELIKFYCNKRWKQYLFPILLMVDKLDSIMYKKHCIEVEGVKFTCQNVAFRGMSTHWSNSYSRKT